MSWIDYWDGQPTIYVNRRHREAHCRSVADGILAHVSSPAITVLDYGCGEALFAADVADRCHRLYLCDAAPSVRADLSGRLGGVANIAVLSPDALDGLAAGSIDLVVANSVAQYLSPAQLADAITAWTRLLAPGGRILIADIVPRAIGPMTDALALLRFAARQGFLIAAVGGLARTFFSDYRHVRASLGLRQFDEAEMIALLGSHGIAASRVATNLGHNQARMAFMARRTAAAAADAEASGKAAHG